jgi:hypothetical protein
MADEIAGEPPGEWVTVAEAARRIGVTPKAVRERIRHGSISWKPNGNAGRLVLVAEPAREPPGEPANDAGEELAELRDALAEERVARARAEGELAAMHALTTELRARAERAEAALAEARRSWLAKVIEGLRRRS